LKQVKTVELSPERDESDRNRLCFFYSRNQNEAFSELEVARLYCKLESISLLCLLSEKLGGVMAFKKSFIFLKTYRELYRSSIVNHEFSLESQSRKALQL
jgi:hypothetical protein